MAMWLEALDLVLSKLVQDGVDLSKVDSNMEVFTGQTKVSSYYLHWERLGEEV